MKLPEITVSQAHVLERYPDPDKYECEIPGLQELIWDPSFIV